MINRQFSDVVMAKSSRQDLNMAVRLDPTDAPLPWASPSFSWQLQSILAAFQDVY